MRYAIVKYSQKPDGKYDEQFIVATKIKDADLASATVILDYQEQKVVKMRLPEATQEDRKFDKINEFYKQHYKETIEEIEQMYFIRSKLVDMVEAEKNEDVQDEEVNETNEADEPVQS